eukprot:scaffold4683_cov112-Cylindrotheca_fusiformis.AAC.3
MRSAGVFIYWLTISAAFVPLGYSKSLSRTVDESSNNNNNDAETCGWDDRDTCGGSYRDPALKPMQVSLRDGTTDIFYAYVASDIATFYNKTEGSMKVTETKFKGLMGKFINMGRKPISIHWKPGNPQQQSSYIAQVEPFGAAGTATFPGHHFTVTDVDNPNTVLDNFHVTKDNSLYVYNPFSSYEEAEKELTRAEMAEYKLQNDNLAFNKLYERFTGRQWLGLYGRKHPPRYPIWPATSFGQMHTVVTKETHLRELPPDPLARKVVPDIGDVSAIREELKKYKGPEETLTLNMVRNTSRMTYYSVPFPEVHHILEVALGMKLSQSTTKAGSLGGERTDDLTRTSRNSWISRNRSPVIDSIIRRSADLLQIDEAYFRRRAKDEEQLLPESTYPINERLQLVHYGVGQQYTPHHVRTLIAPTDFAIPPTYDGQPSRFATILLYLNEVEKGGETSFPRWMNGEHKDTLKVKPEIGKAVLFYNQLPDGNYDERSQHAAMPDPYMP